MNKWIIDLWENNKILFWILIPLVLIVFFKDLILDLLIGSARRISNAARQKDESLKSKEDRANNEANRLRDEANRIQNEIDNINPGEDWNNKK